MHSLLQHREYWNFRYECGCILKRMVNHSCSERAELVLHSARGEIQANIDSNFIL